MFNRKGVQSQVRVDAATQIYLGEVKPNLSEKDGFKHVVLINSFSKMLNQNFGCEDKYTQQLNSIVTLMQHDGYEIVDIVFNSIQGQGFSGTMEGFHTLITYQ